MTKNNLSNHSEDGRPIHVIVYEKANFGAVPKEFRIEHDERWHPVQFVKNTLLAAVRFTDGSTVQVKEEVEETTSQDTFEGSPMFGIKMEVMRSERRLIKYMREHGWDPEDLLVSIMEHKPEPAKDSHPVDPATLPVGQQYINEEGKVRYAGFKPWRAERPVERPDAGFGDRVPSTGPRDVESDVGSEAPAKGDGISRFGGYDEYAKDYDDAIASLNDPLPESDRGNSGKVLADEAIEVDLAAAAVDGVTEDESEEAAALVDDIPRAEPATEVDLSWMNPKNAKIKKDS